jgi:hypothetical protein
LVILLHPEIRQDTFPLLSFIGGVELKETQYIPILVRLTGNILQGQSMWNLYKCLEILPPKGGI